MTTLEDLVADVSKGGRVCPQPMIWKQLWETLPDRRRMGVGWEPPVPLILASWWEASDSVKRERFHLHLKWAFEHGASDAVADLISQMKPEDWHTEQ